MKKYILFDRDGTLIEHVHHLVEISEIRLVRNANTTLTTLKGMGFSFGIITNQSVVSLGLATRDQVDSINRVICSYFEKTNVEFDFVKVCYHSQFDGCLCRKPEIGLLKSEIESNRIDLYNSFMVGDQETDVVFGRNIGVRTIRIINKSNMITSADFSVEDLESVPKVIVQFVEASEI